VIRRQLLDPYRSSPELCNRLSTALIETLAALHSIDLQTAGLAGLGKPQGYVARQVEGWTRRWQGSQTSPLPLMDAVAAWLDANKPSESGAAMIHNDYKLDNLLLAVDQPAQVSAVLDWEMATVGDPLMDVGSALAYWVQPSDPPEMHQTSHSPTAAPGFCSRLEFLERYERAAGRAVVSPLFYYVYGLFKLAVILQQIYIRFVQGLTQDARFGSLGRSVEALSSQAARAIDADSLK
jgi:aminoglycoside phosphotransferase (APT) family kinase protein